MDNPLTVTFEAQSGPASIDGAGAQLTGSISGLAHFHTQPETDAQSTKGDAAIDSAVLSASLVEGGADGSDLAFSADLPDQAGGTVSVVFLFGTAEDPDAAVAKVTSTFKQASSFLFIPTTETYTYTDTYYLHKK